MIDTKTWVKFDKTDNFYGKFTMGPLTPGMGITIGNSLRRVLLSSLTGASITSLKIDSVDHEFTSLPDVVEDVLDIICNIKGLVFKLHSDTPKNITLDYKGKGIVKAKDIKHDAEVEIINSDHHIAEITKNSRLKIDMTIEKGNGYSPAEAHSKEDDDINKIYIDASFSPVIRVNPQVNKVRVGRELDYDSLVLEVWTNGSVDAEEVVTEAASILIKQFSLFGDMNNKPTEQKEKKDVDVLEKKKEAALLLSIEDLELSARSLNCLKKAGIDKVSTLIERNLSSLIQIKNFGKKSAEEINDKLKQYGLSLKNDLKEEE